VAKPSVPPDEPLQIIIQATIVEVSGDSISSALKEIGFRESAAGNRFSATATTRPQLGMLATEKDSPGAGQLVTEILQRLSKLNEIQILSRPQIRALSGHSASVTVGTVNKPIPYLVRKSETTFELKHFTPENQLGISIDVTANAVEDAAEIELMSLKVATTTLDGREEIPGLNIDIGLPLVNTRSLQTSMKISGPNEVRGLAIPGPPGRQPVIFLTARKIDRVPDPPRVSSKSE
jgi:type II secretory pathway component GspD/PulD (secretin)